MSGPQEALYAQLSVTGSSAWAQLHGDITSQLQATVELPHGARTMPMAAARGLATAIDPAVRRAAFEAELRAWPTVRVPLAAAMNAIKGEANIVNERRNWADSVAASQYANSVDVATFDAMQAAVTAALPDLRRWMRAKARLHGYDGGLRWWDLVAPLPMDAGHYDWTAGTRQVREAFATFSRPLTSMADRAFDEHWIDAEPRDGKVGGAFCAPFVEDRSLVLMNWSDSFDSVQTLAHELGHAYHNTQLAHRTALQRQLPMALAETASIFCETLVVDAGLADATGATRLALLDADLQGVTQVVVDIRSRFVFEQRVVEQRRHRTLSPDELCSLMTDAQTEAYGDGLDLATLHPYMWAVKSHYYGSAFYNWPYTFGLLFGLGLHAVFARDPERFRAGYDDLLSRVGMAQAHELAEPFGIDTRDVAFWTASLDTVRARIAEYERLAAELTP
jgi:pepF/M3 family oligoendopeptidase